MYHFGVNASPYTKKFFGGAEGDRYDHHELHPHTVNLVMKDGSSETFPSVGNARCRQITTTDVDASARLGYPISHTVFGEVEGLPAPETGIYYLVSRIVMSAAGNTRGDLLVPNDIIRDEDGHIIGCKSFANN